MNIPLTDFRLSDDRTKTLCGKCNSDIVRHKVSQGYFVGAWFHCTNFQCEQSYNAERNKLWAHIRKIKKEIKELRNDREE